MKKKSPSQPSHARRSLGKGGFFNLRVLIGLFVILAGVFLALLGFGAFSAQAQVKYRFIPNSIDRLVPSGFDCAKIHELGIDKQENLRAGAIMIYCGLSEGGKPSHDRAFRKLVQHLMSPVAFGGTDVNLITGIETFPNVTQSETFTTANPDNPDQIVVAYNDSRGLNAIPINISGASVSTDGGNTFTRLTRANGQSPFDNTFGDPVILYNKPSGTWFTVWLDGGCGGQGLGGYKSMTPWDPDSWIHYCAFNEFAADRESGWADNNPASPFFGNMYISWNDFNVGCGLGGCLFAIRSTDNGATWSTPVQVQTGNSLFIRNTQITGDLSGNGTIYIAGMDEGGGGFPHNDTNYMYKSTDGGVTWSQTYVGSPFPGPGVTAVGYFAQMFSANGGYWRHEGWGEPAAINDVVHLVYAQHGAGSDPGDVYYIRSTDGGVTFSAPFLLNTDGGTRPQWQPNLSVSPAGTLLATWYDARESADTDCQYGNPGSPCYRMFSRKSNDNGVTWLLDDALSDVVSPLPAQPDPGIQPTYAGDYDYGSAVLIKHLTSWTDGRVTISGQSQQDAFTDRELVGFAVTSTDPPCGSVVTTQPTDFIINLSDAVVEDTVDPTDFTVNGIPANSDSFSNGDQTITFHFNSTPVVNQGEQTMHIPADAFTRQSDGQGVFEFNCTFFYDETLLAVTDTVPPDGGTFQPPGPASYTYDMNFNEPVDPNSVQTSDLHLSGVSGSTVTAVSVINGDMTAEFTIQISSIFSGTLTINLPAGAITDTFGNPNASFTGTYQYVGSGGSCSWAAGPNMLSAGVRFVGVFFPGNGKFYLMGGRAFDGGGGEFTNPFEYDPVTNTWTQKSAPYPDNKVNNMACGVLNDAGTDYIYCVGGSESAASTATDRVFRYDPITDTISTVAAPWPRGVTGDTLPGGFAVLNNKLYTIGGFVINVQMISDIWEFTPGVNAWVQKVSLPVERGYVPATAIGNLIYTAGGSSYDGLLHDTTDSFVFDPVANTINPIASIPRATAETRALNFCNQMYVMGGGREAPNPSNEVDIYDPGTNSWTTGLPFVTVRRNFGTDTDGTNTIWLVGGYASDGFTPLDSMEIFNCPISPCGTPTPTPTVTPTATPTATPSATPTVTPTPRVTPRPRPTPHPRPTP
jgi:N-acetylneuraminic acid mutarotase